MIEFNVHVLGPQIYDATCLNVEFFMNHRTKVIVDRYWFYPHDERDYLKQLNDYHNGPVDTTILGVIYKC